MERGFADLWYSLHFTGAGVHDCAYMQTTRGTHPVPLVAAPGHASKVALGTHACFGLWWARRQRSDKAGSCRGEKQRRGQKMLQERHSFPGKKEGGA